MADTLEEIAADYNQPADWTQIIDVTFATPGLRDQDAIWLGRLMFVWARQSPRTTPARSAPSPASSPFSAMR